LAMAEGWKWGMFGNKRLYLSSLPAFAESPVRKGGDECEKGIRHSLGEGGSASAGSAEDVKMPRAEARGASRFRLLDLNRGEGAGKFGKEAA